MNYDVDNWAALTDQLKDNYIAIHVLNRAQIIDDAFTLAQAGKLNYTVPLYISRYLKNETSAIPFYSVNKFFAYMLDRMLRHRNGYGKFMVSEYSGNLRTWITVVVHRRLTSAD